MDAQGYALSLGLLLGAAALRAHDTFLPSGCLVLSLASPLKEGDESVGDPRGDTFLPLREQTAIAAHKAALDDRAWRI